MLSVGDHGKEEEVEWGQAHVGIMIFKEIMIKLDSIYTEAKQHEGAREWTNFNSGRIKLIRVRIEK